MKKNTIKLNIGKYVQIVITTIILILSFLAFTQIDDILFFSQSLNEASENEEIIALYANEYDNLLSEENLKYTTNNQDLFTVIVGNSNSDMSSLVSFQLENLDIPYIYISDLDELSFEEKENAQVFIITDEDISTEMIYNLSNQNKTLVFMNSLTEEHFLNYTIRNIVGVEYYQSSVELEGFRISSEMSFNTIQEQYAEDEFEVLHIKTDSTAKKYIYGLQEDDSIENEDLPPLMWRVHNENSTVYVCHSDIFNTQLTYSVITKIYSEIKDVFIYPIINAYVVLIDGMPYTQNIESDFLKTTYGRDAINLQSSILLPQFTSSKERYGVSTTWYSSQLESVLASDDIELQYYIEYLNLHGDELSQNIEGELISDENFKNIAVNWSPSFEYCDYQNDILNIPIIMNGNENTQKAAIVDATIKSTGYMSLYVDVNEFLSEGEYRWVDYALEYENALALHAKYYPWVEKLTADKAAKRIVSFLSIEPQYTYIDDSVLINIENFIDEAYFILQTDKDILDSTNSQISEIGDNIYLIKAEENLVEVIFEN